MIPNESGCFQPLNKKTSPVDNLQDAAEALADIEGSVHAATEPVAATADDSALPVLVELVNQYARRVQLLTWAVVAIVIVLIMREVKD